MPGGKDKTPAILDDIAAVAAGSGIDAFVAMYAVQTEPLIAIATIAVIHEKLCWIQQEVARARATWCNDWQQGELFTD